MMATLVSTKSRFELGFTTIRPTANLAKNAYEKNTSLGVVLDVFGAENLRTKLVFVNMINAIANLRTPPLRKLPSLIFLAKIHTLSFYLALKGSQYE
jgi:hypothetical protein